jgi:hypothetical protein
VLEVAPLSPPEQCSGVARSRGSVADAEERGPCLVQFGHVFAERALGVDVLGQCIGRVDLAVDVEELDNSSCDEFLQEAHAARDVCEALDGRRISEGNLWVSFSERV